MPERETTFDWEELLLFIEDRSVIPIVGKELLVVPVDDRPVRLERHVAGRLASELGIDAGALSAEFDLNEVAVRYLRQGGLRRKIYSRIKSIMDEQELPVPEPLEKLAAIRHFDLFVSTTFDAMLPRALDAVRFEGRETTRRLAFSVHREIEDLPAGVEQLSAPHVVQIFGPLSPSTEYAVTDEDTLEFLHVLQSESHQPRILFDEFRHSHLLFLGCGFSNWLARFFIRTIANERLIGQRETTEVVADSCAARDANLSLFLNDCRTVTYPGGDVLDFVNELHARWTRRNPEDRQPPKAPLRDVVAGSVFVSYASEDRAAAERLSAALDQSGLDVWFDRSDLEPGDAWDRKIRSGIRRCSLFLPLISENSRRRLEGYFRREWKWAIERAEGIAESVPFVQPILLDEVPEGADEIPAYFWSRQAIRLEGGEPSGEYVERVKTTVRELRLREAGLQ